ncbi:MAG: hypothetical protein CSB34_02405 [Desulfobulbus propionicus]|nr:MAG: hypothetical protein CSB34_02405 [Desulfobulbus propionicus]
MASLVLVNNVYRNTARFIRFVSDSGQPEKAGNLWTRAVFKITLPALLEEEAEGVSSFLRKNSWLN